MSGRPFNRTIIELKHDRRRDSRRVLQTFNRTIIELKPNIINRNKSFRLCLLIALS